MNNLLTRTRLSTLQCSSCTKRINKLGHLKAVKVNSLRYCQDIIPFTRHRPTQIPVFLMTGQPWSELKPDPSISQRTFVNNADTVTHTRVSKVNRNFNENQYEHMCQPVVDIPVVIYISIHNIKTEPCPQEINQ